MCYFLLSIKLMWSSSICAHENRGQKPMMECQLSTVTMHYSSTWCSRGSQLHVDSYPAIVHFLSNHAFVNYYFNCRGVSTQWYLSTLTLYSRYSVFSPNCALHTAITHVITVLEWWSLTWILIVRSCMRLCHSNTKPTWVISVCNVPLVLRTLLKLKAQKHPTNKSYAIAQKSNYCWIPQ